MNLFIKHSHTDKDNTQSIKWMKKAGSKILSSSMLSIWMDGWRVENRYTELKCLTETEKTKWTFCGLMWLFWWWFGEWRVIMSKTWDDLFGVNKGYRPSSFLWPHPLEEQHGDRACSGAPPVWSDFHNLTHASQGLWKRRTAVYEFYSHHLWAHPQASGTKNVTVNCGYFWGAERENIPA